jgi:hypothetical protein
VAAETGFMIDGTLYEVPGLDTLTMDEAQVLYDYSGLTLEDFIPEDPARPDEQSDDLRAKLKNPGFLRALMHIAYQRGNPSLSGVKVKTLIGSASMIGAVEHLQESGEDDALPPASTTEPDGSSPRSSVVSSVSSGGGSSDGSDVPAVPPEATTTMRSDTSSTSPLTTSVA